MSLAFLHPYPSQLPWLQRPHSILLPVQLSVGASLYPWGARLGCRHILGIPAFSKAEGLALSQMPRAVLGCQGQMEEWTK